MRNPFKQDRIVLTASDVMAMLGAKEAELMVARAHLQQAAQMIEQAKAKIAELEAALVGQDEKPAVPECSARFVPTAVK